MAAAMAQASDATPKKGGKKLLIIIGAAVLLLLVAAAAAVYVIKSRAAHAAEDGDEEPVAEQVQSKKSAKTEVPTFLPLDSFTVNLADKTSERYAQVGITLEVDTPENAEKLKAYMPAIRNNVLMVLAHKTSEELLSREGKEKLASEIMRESVRPMGIEIDPEDDEAADEAPKSRKKKRRPVYNPVQHVHFSNFIVQ